MFLAGMLLTSRFMKTGHDNVFLVIAAAPTKSLGTFLSCFLEALSFVVPPLILNMMKSILNVSRTQLRMFLSCGSLNCVCNPAAFF